LFVADRDVASTQHHENARQRTSPVTSAKRQPTLGSIIEIVGRSIIAGATFSVLRISFLVPFNIL
jgi:hypothetical protein